MRHRAPITSIGAALAVAACTSPAGRAGPVAPGEGRGVDVATREVATADATDAVVRQHEVDAPRPARPDGRVPVDLPPLPNGGPTVDAAGAEAGTAPDEVVEGRDGHPRDGVGESCHVDLPSDVAPIDDYAPTLDGRCWPDLVLDCNTPADCKVLCQPVEGYWCFAASSAEPHTRVAGYKSLAGTCWVTRGPSIDSIAYCRPTKVTCEDCRCKGTDYKLFKTGWRPESATDCLDPAEHLDAPP